MPPSSPGRSSSRSSRESAPRSSARAPAGRPPPPQAQAKSACRSAARRGARSPRCELPLLPRAARALARDPQPTKTTNRSGHQTPPVPRPPQRRCRHSCPPAPTRRAPPCSPQSPRIRSEPRGGTHSPPMKSSSLSIVVFVLIGCSPNIRGMRLLDQTAGPAYSPRCFSEQQSARRSRAELTSSRQVRRRAISSTSDS